MINYPVNVELLSQGKDSRQLLQAGKARREDGRGKSCAVDLKITSPHVSRKPPELVSDTGSNRSTSSDCRGDESPQVERIWNMALRV